MYQGLGRREPIFVQESDQYSSDKFLIPNHYKVGLNLLPVCVRVCVHYRWSFVAHAVFPHFSGLCPVCTAARWHHA